MYRAQIGEFLDKYGDGIHGTPNYDDNGEYFFINGNNLGSGRIQIDETTLRVARDEYEQIKRPLNKNTILISINGTIGNIAFYNGEKIALGKSACYLNVKSTENKQFIRYVLETKEFQKYTMQVAHGSTIKNLAPSQIAEYEFLCPSQEERDRIAKALGCIDDKINTNKEVCKLLESMAKTIYDYWFTQFDFPNAESKPYRASGGKMVWNEQLKRDIPEGWEVGRLSDLIKSINTGLNPRDNFKLGGGNIRYITVKNLTTNGTIDFSGCDTIDSTARDIIHKRSDISVGDILFASIAPLGRCYLIQSVPQTWDINESVFSIRADYSQITSEFLYMYFMSDTFIKGATSSSTGSIFKGIRINTLLDMECIIPPREVCAAFSTSIKELLILKERKFEENTELAELRDWLLPMLMNGQATIE